MAGEHLRGTVSGSFRFKKLIDQTIEKFDRLGVEILGPERGTTYSLPSTRKRILVPNFRPLRLEREMTPKQIEDNFLSQILHSDFVYLVNQEGYFGLMSSFELGWAYGNEIPIFALRPINWRLDPDLWKNPVAQSIKAMSPEIVVREVIDRRRIVAEVC